MNNVLYDGSLLRWDAARVESEGRKAALHAAVETANHWRTLADPAVGVAVAREVSTIAGRLHPQDALPSSIAYVAWEQLAARLGAGNLHAYTLEPQSEAWVQFDDDRNWRAYWVLHYLLQSLADYCREMQEIVAKTHSRTEPADDTYNVLATGYDMAVTCHQDAAIARYGDSAAWTDTLGTPMRALLVGYVASLDPTVRADPPMPPTPAKPARPESVWTPREGGAMRRLVFD